MDHYYDEWEVPGVDTNKFFDEYIGRQDRIRRMQAQSQKDAAKRAEQQLAKLKKKLEKIYQEKNWAAPALSEKEATVEITIKVGNKITGKRADDLGDGSILLYTGTGAHPLLKKEGKWYDGAEDRDPTVELAPSGLFEVLKITTPPLKVGQKVVKGYLGRAEVEEAVIIGSYSRLFYQFIGGKWRDGNRSLTKDELGGEWEIVYLPGTEKI